jgi:hypothetical protein
LLHITHFVEKIIYCFNKNSDPLNINAKAFHQSVEYLSSFNEIDLDLTITKIILQIFFPVVSDLSLGSSADLWRLSKKLIELVLNGFRSFQELLILKTLDFTVKILDKVNLISN